MNYHIYCNEKNINTNYILAIEEFKKRLSAYCETSLHVNSTLVLPKDIHAKNHHFIIIQAGISTYSSEQFSSEINALQINGKSTIHVIIGYDDNTCYEQIHQFENCDTPMYMSLSNSALSNETKTLLFYEQLYRAYTILQGKTYHK